MVRKSIFKNMDFSIKDTNQLEDSEIFLRWMINGENQYLLIDV